MNHNLSEIFYNGRIVNLQNMEEAQAEEILKNLRDRQVMSKEKISICLDKMKSI